MRPKKQVPGLECPLDHEYSAEEWRAFVACARKGMESGERLHHEFDAKMAEHGLAPRQVETSVHFGAALACFVNQGVPRLALWDPRQRLVVIATVPDGLVLTAFPLRPGRDARDYLYGFDEVRWLKV